jgi:hypothetical protein
MLNYRPAVAAIFIVSQGKRRVCLLWVGTCQLRSAVVEDENSDRQVAARGGGLPYDPATYALQVLRTGTVPSAPT